MKKMFFIAILCITVAALIWMTFLYMMFYRKPAAPQVPENAILSAENSIQVGKELLSSVEFPIPYFGKTTDIIVAPGKHAVISGMPKKKCIKHKVFERIEKITIPLRMISPGVTDDAEFSFTTSIFGKKFKHTVKIPEFKTSEPSPQNIETLQLASKEIITPPDNVVQRILVIASVLVVTAVFLIVLYLVKFRKKNTALSDWEKAREELSRLKSDVAESRITPENGFIRLTDLVRGYLEKRFGLPATRRTTPEFIEDISKNGDFLPDDRKPFLRNFLESADQVKFAMAHPEKELLSNALVNAESLVDATRPPEEEKNV